MEKETVRETGKRLLKEQMLIRAAETTVKYNITKKYICDFVKNVEKELFDLYNDVGFKYKAKFRSLIFNIKDRKNLYVWEQICKKKINSHELVRLTPKELASHELTRWRKKEMKRQLELVKKRELELLAANKTYVLKTHKGDRVMKNETAIKTELDPEVPVEKIVSVLNNTDTLKKEKKQIHEKKTKGQSGIQNKSAVITNDDLNVKEKHIRPKAITKGDIIKTEPKKNNFKQTNRTNSKQKSLGTKHVNRSTELGSFKGKRHLIDYRNRNNDIKLYEIDIFSETSIHNGLESANNKTIENKHENPEKPTMKTLSAEKFKEGVNNFEFNSNKRAKKQMSNNQINADLSSVENKTLKEWSNIPLTEKKKKVAKILNRVNNVLKKEHRIKGEHTKEKSKPKLKDGNEKTATSVSPKIHSSKVVDKKLGKIAKNRTKIYEDSERKLRSWSKYNLRSNDKKIKILNKKVSKKDINYFLC